MTAQETKVVNGIKTTLASTMAAGATSFVVTSASGFPAVPFYVAIDPLDPAKREFMLVDQSVAGTTCSLSGAGKRNLAGSAGALEHLSGVTVRISPVMAQLFEDVHDRVDAVETSISDHIVDTVGAHAATAISYAGVDNTGTGDDEAATTVEAALDDLFTNKLAKAGGTMSGALAMADNEIGRAKFKDYSETIEAVGNSGTSKTLDFEAGNTKTVTMTGNCTFAFSNPPVTGTLGAMTLFLLQDATGSRTATWPAAMKWAGGVAPVLSTAAGALDIITVLTKDAGTTYYGFLGGKAFA